MWSQKSAYFLYRAFRRSQRILAKSPLRRTRVINLFGRELRFVSSSEVLPLPLIWYPQFEREHLVAYTDFVQMQSIVHHLATADCPVVVDVGAYHGLYAILLGHIARERGGRVIACEPVPESYDILCRNVAENGLEDTVLCEQLAVGIQNGTAEFSLDRSQSRTLTQTEAESHQATPGLRVEVVTIGELLSRHSLDRISELIIDVEGMELAVLQGIPQGLLIDSIFCELHPYN